MYKYILDRLTTSLFCYEFNEVLASRSLFRCLSLGPVALWHRHIACYEVGLSFWGYQMGGFNSM